MTRVELVALAFAANAPSEMAAFWAHALGWDIHRGDDRHVIELVPTDATTFRLRFVPGAEPKVGQNPIHFDLTSSSLDDQHESVRRLLELDARHVDVGQGPEVTHVVLADPEGNELCIIEPGNEFLASCPRLGAVNCDGTRALGCFYAAALGWPLVWDEGEETAIQAPDGTGPKITWSGPPLMPKSSRERLHFHLAPSAGTTVFDALEHLLSLGATRLDGDRSCPGATGLADVDGNAVCLVER